MAKLQQRSLKKEKSRKQNSKAVPASWKKKMMERERKARIHKLSDELKKQLEHEQQTARDARKANRERKAENEKRNMVVQEIKNIKAVKKLSPKQRRRARIVLKHEL